MCFQYGRNSTKLTILADNVLPVWRIIIKAPVLHSVAMISNRVGTNFDSMHPVYILVYYFMYCKTRVKYNVYWIHIYNVCSVKAVYTIAEITISNCICIQLNTQPNTQTSCGLEVCIPNRFNFKVIFKKLLYFVAEVLKSKSLENQITLLYSTLFVKIDMTIFITSTSSIIQTYTFYFHTESILSISLQRPAISQLQFPHFSS